MWLLALFVAIPLIEIALFIQIGGAIGLFPTLVIVVLTAIAGTWLVRSQGTQALIQLRQSFEDLRDPAEPLAHGAMILFAGALLLTPGFFTDAVGLAFLVPSIRRSVFQYAKSRIKMTSFEYGQEGQPRPRDDIIEGQWEEVGQGPGSQPQKPSGWTRH